MRFPAAKPFVVKRLQVLALCLAFAALFSVVHATTFPDWQGLHFTTEQLADSAISGAKADPDGDGISNLLEYTYASDPWLTDGEISPRMGWEQNHLTLVYRKARNASDLFVGLQTSSDLLTWTFPNGVDNSFDYTFDDYYLITLTDPQTIGGASQHFLRLTVAIDTDQDGLPDNWEMRYFGNLYSNSFGNPDGDLLNNLAEFRQQTNPVDFYNGSTPEVVLISGNNQMPDGNDEALPLPLTVRVQTTAGTLLANAPLDFSVTTGQGDLSQLGNIRTAANGLASVTFTPTDGAHASTVLAQAKNYPSSVIFSILAKVDAPLARLAERRSTGEVRVTWTHPLPNAVSFIIERASDGVEWQPIATAPTGSDEYTDPTAVPGIAYIYRIKAQGSTASLPSQIIATEPEEDADIDGLTNQEEANIGSLLQNAYSDSDLIADGEDAIPTDGDLTFARITVPNYAVVNLPDDFYITGINSSGTAVGFDTEGMKVWAKGQLLPIPVYEEGEHGLSNITLYGPAYIDDQGKIVFTQHGYGTGLDAVNGNANDGYGHLTGVYQYNGTTVVRSGSILSAPTATSTGYEGYASVSGISHDGRMYGASLGLVAPYITTPATDDSPIQIENRHYDASTYWSAPDLPVHLKGFPFSNDSELTDIRSRILGASPSTSTVYNEKGIDDTNSIYGANALGRLCGNSTELYDCSIEFFFHRPGWDFISPYLGIKYQTQHKGLLWPSTTSLPIFLGDDAYLYSINDLDIVAGYKNVMAPIPFLWLGSKSWEAKELPLYGEKKKYIFPTAINTKGMMLMSNYTDLWVNGFSYDLGEQCGKAKGTVYAGRLTESGVMSASVLNPQTGIYNNAILMPMEILVPKIDNNGNPVDTNGTAATVLVDGSRRLKVAQWENAHDNGNDQRYATVKEEFIKYDPDRFYIRIPNMGTTAHPMEVELATLGRDGAVLDAAKKILMVSYSADPGYLKSLAHILVSDDVDDQFSGKGAGTDGDILDRTHKVEVEGKLKITIKVGTQTGEAIIQVPQTEKIKTVKVKAIIVRNTPGGAAPATIEQVRDDIKTNVCQRFAQVNLRAELDGDPVIMDAPANKNYTIGIVQDFNNEIFDYYDIIDKAVQENIATADGEKYYIFYVNALASIRIETDGTQTRIRNDFTLGRSYLSDNPIKFRRKGFVGYASSTASPPQLPIVTAHELLHMIMDLGHYDDDTSAPNAGLNLMLSGPTLTPSLNGEAVAVGKRLYNSQKLIIRSHVP